MDETVQWRFERGDWGAGKIQAAVDDILTELADPGSDEAHTARAAGLDPALFAGATVRVWEDRQGLDPSLTAILVGIAVKVGSSAVEALWRDLIWPGLRRRLGGRPLGDRMPDQPAGEPAASDTAGG